MQLLTQSTDNKTDFVDINILVISKSMPEEVIVTLVVSDLEKRAKEYIETDDWKRFLSSQI